MCIVLYVKLILCSGIPYTMVNGGGRSALSICALCYMLNLFGVVVFHTSMVNWWVYMHSKYMSIVLYVKCI